MTFNENQVTQDALREYITNKGCSLQHPENDSSNLAAYLTGLFDKNTATKTIKHVVLRTRIDTARELLHQLVTEYEGKTQ